MGRERRLHTWILALGAAAGALLGGAFAGAVPVGAQAAGSAVGPVLVVGGIDPGSLALVDAARFELLAVVPGLEQVHGAAVLPGGGRAYALSFSNAERAVTVVDVAARRTVRTVSLPAPAHHAAVSPDGGWVYVAFGTMGLDPERPRGVAVLDLDGGVLALVDTEGTPFGFGVLPGGERLLVSVRAPDEILSVDLQELRVTDRVSLEGGPAHLAVSPDGRRAYVTLSVGGVAALDTRSLEVLARVEVPPDAHAVALAGRPLRVFAASRGPSTLTVLDAASMEVLERTPLGGVPSHLTALPDGTIAVSMVATREIVRLDPDGLRITARVPLPFQPHQSNVSGGR